MTRPRAPITGPLHRTTDPGIKAQRDAWVREQREAGLTQREIAAALGIAPSAVHDICVRLGLSRNPRHVHLPLRMIGKIGVRIGHLGEPIMTLPPDVRDKLVATAARKRTTIAEVLVESYAATLTK